MNFHALSWIINDECNLHCAHCYPDSGPKTPPPFDADRLLKMTDHLRHMHFDKIYISGGEPLACSHLEDYLKAADKLADRLYICTNALLLDDEILDLLIKYHVHITVSLQHTDGSAASEIYGAPDIGQKIQEKIKYLRHKGVPVKLEVTVMRINHRDLENFFIFARENGIHKIDFKRFRPVGRGNHHKNTFGLTKSENADALSPDLPLISKYPEMDISTDDPLYGMVVSSELHRQGWTDTAVSAYIKDKQIFGCKAGRRWVGLNPSGNIAPCPLLLYCGISIGNLLEDSLEDILENSEMIRQLKDSRCDGCAHADICGGCRVCACYESEDIYGKDPMCVF